MRGSDPRGRPAAPPSEVEWEELLVRIEIAPRALRLAVEDADAEAAVLAPLRDAVREEARLQELLDAMAAGTPPAAERAPPATDGDDAADLARRFASLRARTFAMVQRRGLGVWEWRLDGGPWAGATSYQLLQAAAERDGRVLAAVRGAGR